MSLFTNARTEPEPPDDGAVRRCVLYRRSFPLMDIAFPALALRNHAVARWIREHDVAVDVRSSEDLRIVISAGVHPGRLTVHAGGVVMNELAFCAANLAVRFVVVDSVEQAAVLTGAIGPQRRQAVIVRMAGGSFDAVTSAAVRSRRLSLVGLHADIGSGTDEFVSYPAAIGDTVAQMCQVRRTHGHVLPRLSLGGVPGPADDWAGELPQHAAAIDESLDDACLTVDYPRPVVSLASALAATDKRAA